MSEDQKNQLTSILECRKCKNNFDDLTSDRAPRKLTTCGHTICGKCASELLKGSVITCPFDNQLTKLSDGNINSLLKNFALIEVIKELKRIDASRPTKKHVQFEDIIDDDLNTENRCFENSSHEAVASGKVPP
ncbi:hypothetical protein GCK72_003669 [Caenorhabditis remanei]|uniref:RING-type domain-containing protein n=1 Tax=Caenorhabditis remanei TaxID=31234 RepID=A0A6A5HA66_CAERE|nr:hypothetical protein GCK72_003669 [Caenorhabditis remanei]KAF1763724.1 hypothetical protein GCK72_003669 [Caenorhabditis remanei]